MQPVSNAIGGIQALAGHYSATQLKKIFRQPVIIVSAPRSGSTLLFEQLARIPDFWTIGGESHVVFGKIPWLRAQNKQMDSGCLTTAHADTKTRQILKCGFLLSLQNNQGARYLELPKQLRPPRICFLEKTPRNALNIPFLLKVFPDARFIYLHRDPRENVASIVNAWEEGLRSGRFVTFRDLPDWDRDAWCLLLPPGWRSLKGKSLVEISAFQWMASNEIIMKDLSGLPKGRLASISYSELIRNPGKELSRLCRFSGLKDASVLAATIDTLPMSRTTLTPPDPDKWRRYEAELEQLMPGLDRISSQIANFG